MLQFTPYYHIPWSLLHKLQQIKIKWKLARSTFFGETAQMFNHRLHNLEYFILHYGVLLG